MLRIIYQRSETKTGRELCSTIDRDGSISYHSYITSHFGRSLKISHWWWQMIILLICGPIRSHQQFQSLIAISDPGTQFVPVDTQGQLFSTSLVGSFQSCAIACHADDRCDTFDFGANIAQQCRLFEGNVNTLGSIGLSLLASSNVGIVQRPSILFTSYGLPCSIGCQQNRYLTCNQDSICRCTRHTYWNSSSSMCLPQSPVIGVSCEEDGNICRTDLNLTCLQFNQCGPRSVLSGTKVVDTTSVIAGTMTTVLQNPTHIITREMNGNSAIFYADETKHHVASFYDRNGNIGNLTIVARNWTASTIAYPGNIFIDVNHGNNLYVTENFHARVMLFTALQSINPLPQTVVGILDNSGTGPHQLQSAMGVVVDSQSRVFVSELQLHRVVRWTLNATYGVIIAGTTGISGNSSSQLYYPTSLSLDELNSWLYVCDWYNHRIQRFSLGGTFPANGITVAGGNGAGSGSNQLNQPASFWVSPRTSTIYIADTNNNRIQRWRSGDIKGVTMAGSMNGSSGSNSFSLNSPQGVALNANETRMYVSDYNNRRIQRFQII